MSRVTSPARPSPVTTSWTKTDILLFAVVFLVIAGVIARFAIHHPAPRPTVFPIADFHQAATTLEARLQQDPRNFDLLTTLGNLNFDHQQYADAASYYRRALEIHPNDVNARTNLGTCLSLTGDPDGAIQQYQTALTYDPDSAATLDALGLVQFHAKHDPKAATATWEHLLAAHPSYSGRPRIEALLSAAKLAK